MVDKKRGWETGAADHQKERQKNDRRNWNKRRQQEGEKKNPEDWQRENGQTIF